MIYDARFDLLLLIRIMLSLDIMLSYLVLINVMEIMSYHQICVPKKSKDINVKVFNMITNKN